MIGYNDMSDAIMLNLKGRWMTEEEYGDVYSRIAYANFMRPIRLNLPSLLCTVQEAEVAEPVAPPADAPPKKEEEKKESVEDIEKRARKPPADGPCKGCGKNLPLNRLMLCFRCWVNKNLDDWATANGRDFIPTVDPHPAWCKCGLPEHGGKR
jgi:hypothetical protein